MGQSLSRRDRRAEDEGGCYASYYGYGLSVRKEHWLTRPRYAWSAVGAGPESADQRCALARAKMKLISIKERRGNDSANSAGIFGVSKRLVIVF